MYNYAINMYILFFFFMFFFFKYSSIKVRCHYVALPFKAYKRAMHICLIIVIFSAPFLSFFRFEVTVLFDFVPANILLW